MLHYTDTPQLISSCTHLIALFGGISTPCLIDTGSMVTTITESWFHEHFEQKVKTCQWLQLRAANGLEILYLGYVEVDVELCGKLVPRCGVLVVRDPPGALCTQVPGVLGMNVLRRYQELFGQHGPVLFDLPSVSEAPSIMVQALQYFCQVSTHPAAEAAGGRIKPAEAGRVKGKVGKVFLLPERGKVSGARDLIGGSVNRSK